MFCGCNGCGHLDLPRAQAHGGLLDSFVLGAVGAASNLCTRACSSLGTNLSSNMHDSSDFVVFSESHFGRIFN